MKKTLIPNSIIIFSIIYFTIMIWGFTSTENRMGFLFYAVILAIFSIGFIYERDKFACILKIEDYKLKFNYIFLNVKNIEIDLYKIQGDITLKRFHGRDFAGGFPTLSNYLNFRWYFSAERYELEFWYEDKLKTVPFQANIIGLKSFLDSVIYYANVINEGEIRYSKSNLGKAELATELSALAIKLLIKS
jgi:hypothetical protein